jgi:hypothetical protein
MSEVKTPPVVAKMCDDIDAVEATPGAFEFYVSRGSMGKPAGLIYCCPCGCGRTGALAFRPAPSPSWEWDGNREKPTLKPSVHHVGHWHGYLRDGVWVSC